jgi:anaerobic ribonucleoside-triphosphate reductase activating protein
VEDILDLIDVLIDGPYIEALRDITLEMRGSSNQRIIDLSKKL